MLITTPLRIPRPIEATRPEGCVCDAREWSGGEIAPICRHYEPANPGDTRCGWCEHDEACHER